MTIRSCLRTPFVLALLGAVAASRAQVQPQLAEQYFKEAQALCERDGGRLWGISLCGPMVIADAATGTIATSQPAPAGDRPRILGIVNAPIQWGGVTWSAYNWQMIPKDDQGERGRLFMHELFHCIQPRLGLTTSGSADTPAHLDSLEGRYWMRLEWRALSRALNASGAARTSAIADALAFRAARYRQFPGAAAAEHPVEINEGTATYTQYVLGSDNAQDAIRAATATLAAAETGTSFVKTFAYASGAGYGLLLDALSPGWHRKMTAASDFGQLLSAAAGVTAATDAAAAATRYDGASLRAAEEQRDREQQVIIAELRRRYVDGQVLVVPRAGSGSVNNMGATVIPGAGTVFREMANKSAWGSFDAKNGVLVSADGQTISLPAPVVVDATTMKGDGWTATVGPGWTVQPDPRPGSFRVVRQETPAVPRPAIAAIVDAFRQHRIVGLGDAHGDRQGDAFQLALIRDPAFRAVVNDIIVESGNSRYQDLADRFVRGETVAPETLQQIWADTTQQGAASLDVPEIFTTVRALNASAPPDRRLRILLGEPPIQWERIKTADDWTTWEALPTSDRDWFGAELVTREVVGKNRRALALYGAGHFFRKVVNQSLVTILEGSQTKVFTIWTNAAAELANIQPDVRTWPVPSLAQIRGTALGKTGLSTYLGPNAGDVPPQWLAPMEDQFDAVLYLGPLSGITFARPKPWRCGEPALPEHVRRANLQRPGLGDRVKEQCAGG